MGGKNAEEHNDTRTTKELLKEWRKLQEVRRSLVRDGLINGDASPAEIIAALRVAIPPETFAEKVRHTQ